MDDRFIKMRLRIWRCVGTCDADHVIHCVVIGKSTIEWSTFKASNCCYGNHVGTLSMSIRYGMGNHGNYQNRHYTSSSTKTT